MKTFSKIATLLFSTALLTLSACSKEDKSKLLEEKPSAEEIYQDATAKLSDGQFQNAILLFEDLERTYPYSPLATKSKLMAGYTQYRDEQYDSAIASLERFIKLHPGNKDVSYAYYLKALSYYEQITDVGRDQSVTEEAQVALKEVIARFPDSEYARDAKLKSDLVNDHLAGKEMEIGRFYLNNEQIPAAINRFQKVVREYQTTSHVSEALHRLVESYLILGIVPEAQKYAAVLGANYPGSEWYQRSYDLMQSKGFNIDKPVDETDETDSFLNKVWPFKSEEQ